MAASVRVLAFAGAREVLGCSELEFELAAPLTARALLARIVERFPRLAPYASSLRLAVNDRYAGWDEEVRPGDEVAILPPVAGG